ncbi:hypothetical protein GCM10009798_04020 [Nocardioides panacihumi]|uniref:Htaa domain-containing protein n=1 Tax=Nocardioides panacihumi TaxID=400774 RepID=A0ABN2QAR0_9ACTN
MPEPGLAWAVRASFLAYVAGLPDGRASVSGGATLTFDDPQRVIFAPDPEHTTAVELAYRGDLRLAGHGGLLFVRLANPRLRLDGDRAVLSVDDPRSEDGSGPRLDLVRLRLDEDGSGRDVRLLAAGVPLFNHVYAEGEPFDDLAVLG